MIYFYDNNIMGLFKYLVTSQTRRDLLNLLWHEGVEASGHQLALLAKTAYSAAHAELEAMKEEGLVTSHKEGRAEVFSKNNKYPFKQALLTLLQAPPSKNSAADKVTENALRANLAKFGAPLVTSQSTSGLSLEETLVRGLELARHDATVARSLPVAFARNKKSLDLARLEFLARKNKVLPVLGFYLDLTAFLLKDQKLHSTAQSLADRRRKKMEMFFKTRESGAFEQTLAEQNTPPLARKWRFLMNMGMDSFESLFKKNFPEGTSV